MRWVLGIVLVAACSPSPLVAEDPKRSDLLAAFEKRLTSVAVTAGPSIACVVVSRSEHYPKVPEADAAEGKLGGFDPKVFLKSKPTAERAVLAKSLDLADPMSIPDHGYAGGVVVDSAGLVLTPYHAIDGATKVYVFLPGGVGSYADIRAADARSDLAVLKLVNPPKKLTPIKFAEVRTSDRGPNRATVTTGKLVILMANPYTSNFRLDKPSAAFGSITNVRHRLTRMDGKEDQPMEKQASYYKHAPLLEYDAKVNPSVTGGALLNLDGELIGLTTATAVVYDNREIGPGYAIPTDENFRRIVKLLMDGKEIEYGFMGITLVEAKSRAEPGVEIGLVTPEGPADKVLIRPRDLITAINGYPIQNYDDLLLHIGSGLAGTKVKLTVSTRRGESHETELTLAKFKSESRFIASVRPEPVFGLRVDWGSVAAQLPTPRDRLPRMPPGVSVREVVPDSPAAKQFKTLGDDPKRWLIIEVNGKTVANPREFYDAAKGEEKVTLTLIDASDPNRRARELILP